MKNKQADRSEAITKRIGNPEIDRIKKRYHLQGKDDVLDSLSRQSVGDVLNNIAAAGELIMAAGEHASSLQGLIKERLQHTTERQKILYEDANMITLLANIEYFFDDVEECRKFIETLTPKGRENFFGVLMTHQEDGEKRIEGRDQ